MKLTISSFALTENQFINEVNNALRRIPISIAAVDSNHFFKEGKYQNIFIVSMVGGKDVSEERVSNVVSNAFIESEHLTLHSTNFDYTNIRALAPIDSVSDDGSFSYSVSELFLRQVNKDMVELSQRSRSFRNDGLIEMIFDNLLEDIRFTLNLECSSINFTHALGITQKVRAHRQFIDILMKNSHQIHEFIKRAPCESIIFTMNSDGTSVIKFERKDELVNAINHSEEGFINISNEFLENLKHSTGITDNWRRLRNGVKFSLENVDREKLSEASDFINKLNICTTKIAHRLDTGNAVLMIDNINFVEFNRIKDNFPKMNQEELEIEKSMSSLAL